MIQSSPISIGGLQFAVSTQAQWQEGLQQIELIIVNPGRQTIAFPLFETFSFSITSLSGEIVQGVAFRTATFFPKPILIHPGERYVLCRPAELVTRNGKSADMAMELNYKDGTGTSGSLFPLRVGIKYRLIFQLSPRPDPRPVVLPNDPPIWSGSGKTKAVDFEITQP